MAGMTGVGEPTIRGVYVANVTPFSNDLEIDQDAYLAHLRWLEGKGVTGAIPFGTNGEGPSLGLGEKIALLETLFAQPWRMQIIPTVAQGNLPESLELVRFMNDLPVTALLLLPAYYFKPTSEDGLRRFFEPLVAASRHPVILYHIPKYAVPLPVDLVTSLPVWGVKDSAGEPGYADTLLKADKGVLLGTEDDLWGRLSGGAQGAISALANIVPEHLVALYRYHQQGDTARGQALSQQLQTLRAKTKAYTAASLLKKIASARHGIPLGTVRPPLVPAPDDYDPHEVLTLAGVEVDAGIDTGVSPEIEGAHT